jgi:hypothetical protein
LKLEEKQWRKSVLDVLRCIVIAVNNNKPRDGTGVEFAESDLRKRFLS